jgi:hypothetical protein
MTSGPRNQDDIFDITKQQLSLQDKILEEEFNRSQKSQDNADKLAELQKDYYEDLAKENKDYQDEMKELAEDYYEDMKKLQEESEITKRGNKADFYESLFGMDLTNEQRAAYIDQYKGYEAEAVKLRGEGNFTAAQAVLDTGSQNILNQAKYDQEVIENKDKIKTADEEIAELNKDMAQAKEADDRAEIQRKINKANQDKLDAENRIKQIEGLRQLRADADREELDQARKKEEEITKKYEEETEKRKKDHEEKLADMEKAYKKSLEERTKADDAATRKELVNRGLLIELELYRTKISQLATLYANNASDQAIKNQKMFIQSGEKRILDMAAPELQPILEGFFTSMKSLDAGPAQELDPAVAQQLKTLDNNTTALGNNTDALTTLVNTLGKAIFGNRLRVTFS